MRAHGLLLLALVPLATTGCSRPAAEPPRTLRVLMGASPTSLDPHTSFDDVTSVVLGNVYEPLVQFDRNLRLGPGLALRWINPDDRTWRFFLDPQARFPDGAPLLASDVRFSIERVRSVAGSQLTGFVRHVARVTVVDDHTVDVHTDQPVAILNGLALIPIVSERHTRAVGDALRDRPHGTGPYKVTEWKKGSRIVLEANPYGRVTPEVHRAEFDLRDGPLGPEEITAAAPDLALYMRRRIVAEFQRHPPRDLQLLSADGLTVYYMTLNTRPTVGGRPNPLADPRVRRALARSLDLVSLARDTIAGLQPAAQMTVPQVFGYDPDLAPLPFDAEAARALLAEAGHPGLELQIDVVTEDAPIENAVARQLAKAGVRPTLRRLSPGEATAALEAGTFMASVEGYAATSADASELLTYLLHSPGSEHGYGAGNHAGYRNPEMDRIAEQNLAVFDPRERRQMLQRALRLAAEDAPYVPLFVLRDFYVVRRGIAWVPPVSGELRLAEIRRETPR